MEGQYKVRGIDQGKIQDKNCIVYRSLLNMVDKKYHDHHFRHILKEKQVMLVSVASMGQVLSRMVLWLINQPGLKLMLRVCSIVYF